MKCYIKHKALSNDFQGTRTIAFLIYICGVIRLERFDSSFCHKMVSEKMFKIFTCKFIQIKGISSRCGVFCPHFTFLSVPLRVFSWSLYKCTRNSTVGFQPGDPPSLMMAISINALIDHPCWLNFLHTFRFTWSYIWSQELAYAEACQQRNRTLENRRWN